VGRFGLGRSAQDHRCHGPRPNRDKARNPLPKDQLAAPPATAEVLAAPRITDRYLRGLAFG